MHPLPPPMENPVERVLAQRPLIVLDGALATELETRGANLKDPLWSANCLIDQPDLIQGIHRDYLAAGADVATTATYQATFEGFGRRGLGHGAAARLMRRAVALAGAAREEFWGSPANRVGRMRPLIAASIGPYGAMLADGSEYVGRYACSDRVLRDFHRARLDVLASAGADLFACETLPCLREALTIAELLRDYRLPAWISFSCCDERRTCEGEDVADCATALRDFREVAAIGVNCTDPRFVTSLLRRMAGVTTRPLVAYPNSGESYRADSKTWECRSRGDSLASQAQTWYGAGARLIGGCCRTTPADISAIADVCAVNARRS